MPGGWEWAVLVLIGLLLFGGSRLAGIGRNAGRAVRAFKEETSALRDATTVTQVDTRPPAGPEPDIVDAEIVPDRTEPPASGQQS